MTLDRLADAPLPAVQLHGTLGLERRRVRRVARATIEDERLFTSTCPVVDDLCDDECGMTVKYLLRGGGLVRDCPVEGCGFRDKTKGGVRNPLSEDDILVVDV